tara:strand:+ start:337 stop:498 length:162 start_codon:yes stop_codon:yes gene_type:complete
LTEFSKGKQNIPGEKGIPKKIFLVVRNYGSRNYGTTRKLDAPNQRTCSYNGKD